MKKKYTNDSEKNRTRKTKRWFTLLSFCMMLFMGQIGFSQVLDESFDNATLPSGWTQEYVNGTADWATVISNQNNTITPLTGSHMAEFRITDWTSSSKLITPSLDLTSLTTPLLTFYYANVQWLGDIDELRVYYKTSASGSWVQIGSDYTEENTSWKKVEIILPNPSADYYIAFEAKSNYARGLNLDDVMVSEALACLPPAGDTAQTLAEGQTLADLVVTGETGAVLTWYADSGLNTEIPATTEAVNGTTYYVTQTLGDCTSGALTITVSTGVTAPACDIVVNISFPEYGDVTTWQLIDGSGTAVLSGGPYEDWLDYNFSISATHIAVNPPYSLEITIDDSWWEYCDNQANYSVTVGGVQDISGTVTACEELVIVNVPLTADLTVCIPSCPAPSNLGVANLTSTSADLSWTSSGTLFDIEWGEAGFIQGSGTTVNDITATTHSITGLATETSYEFYVRQDCGATDGESTWVGPFSFTTPCNATTVPYTQDFSSAVVPDMPSCTSVENAGTGNNWVTYDGTGYGFTGKHLRYSWHSNNNANSWFYTQGIELNAGTTYKVSYDYGGTSTIFPEKLKVAYGSSPVHSSMTAILADHTNVINDTPINNEVEFTPTTSGVYYFGFNAYSNADEFHLHLDNIIIDAVTDPCADLDAPTGEVAQTLDLGDTLADLIITGEDGAVFTWYTDSGLNTEIPASTEAVDGATYYVTQTVEDCISEALTITVTVIDPCADLDAPAGDATQTLDLENTLANLIITGEDDAIFTWYADADLNTEIPATTAVVDGMIYYVTQTVGDCTSEALAITVTVVDPCADVLAPVAESPQSMTVEQTVADIDVVGENLTWYSDSDLTTIVEESFVLTEGTYTFWVTQTIGDCTSTATEIEIEVTLSTDRFDTASFRAYPNPVKDFFNISYSTDITDVMVINMLGQTVISKTVNAADTQIDMSLLPTGTYFVKVNLDGIIKTIKVAKQ